MISEYADKPELFAPGEPKFWDDPHIAKSMLEAHLNPELDAASRKAGTIDKTVANLLSSGFLKPGDRLLDLGCGPGLYAAKFAEQGLKVTGVDISENSLAYARGYAREKGLDIDYLPLNFLDLKVESEFETAVQIYGEMCVFSDADRDKIFENVRRALTPGGLFIFDITTHSERAKNGMNNFWYISDGGFWRPGRHLVLQFGFDYPEQDVWLDQYIIIDENVTVYRNWFHNYSLATITPVVEKAGFKVEKVWNDLTGTEYSDSGDWIALVCRKT